MEGHNLFTLFHAFYYVVQQWIVVQNIYYWNVYTLVHGLEILHKLLGSGYDEINH
jgi:hypothetical protein